MQQADAQTRAKALYNRYRHLETDPYAGLQIKTLLRALKAIAEGTEGGSTDEESRHLDNKLHSPRV